MRRFLNWAREVNWYAVVGVTLLVLAILAAVLVIWYASLVVLALVLAIAGLGVIALSLRA